MQETEKLTMDHFTFYILGEVTGCDICKSYKNQARYYTIRARNRHRTEYYNYRDTENSCNFNRPLSYCLDLIFLTFTSNLPMEC